MKRSLQLVRVISVIIITVNLFTACEKNDGPVAKDDSVTMGPEYPTDVYYSMENGVVAEVPRTEWDIAFGVDAQSSAILINEAAGVELKAYPSTGTTPEEMWSEAIDLTDYDNWDNLLNPDTTWADGFFGMNATEFPNYGWGNYNMASHNVEGSCLYIIKTRSGSFMKIFIEMKYSMQQRYTFKFADLEAKVENSVDLDCSDSNANFVYYSLEDNERLDREPDKDTWDLLFTKYTDNSINYNVTGVLSNLTAMVIQKDGVTFNDFTWTDDEFSDNINIIGSDWKSFDMENMVYVVDEEKVFVVKDASENQYLLQFTGFDMTNGRADFKILKK